MGNKTIVVTGRDFVDHRITLISIFNEFTKEEEKILRLELEKKYTERGYRDVWTHLV